MRQSRIKEGSKGEFPHLQDTIWRQQNWNLANQSITANADCQNYSECDCECDLTAASE